MLPFPSCAVQHGAQPRPVPVFQPSQYHKFKVQKLLQQLNNCSSCSQLAPHYIDSVQKRGGFSSCTRTSLVNDVLCEGHFHEISPRFKWMFWIRCPALMLASIAALLFATSSGAKLQQPQLPLTTASVQPHSFAETQQTASRGPCNGIPSPAAAKTQRKAKPNASQANKSSGAKHLFASVTVTSSVSSTAPMTPYKGQKLFEILASKLTLLVQQILGAHVAIKVGNLGNAHGRVFQSSGHSNESMGYSKSSVADNGSVHCCSSNCICWWLLV